VEKVVPGASQRQQGRQAVAGKRSRADQLRPVPQAGLAEDVVICGLHRRLETRTAPRRLAFDSPAACAASPLSLPRVSPSARVASTKREQKRNTRRGRRGEGPDRGGGPSLPSRSPPASAGRRAAAARTDRVGRCRPPRGDSRAGISSALGPWSGSPGTPPEARGGGEYPRGVRVLVSPPRPDVRRSGAAASVARAVHRGMFRSMRTKAGSS